MEEEQRRHLKAGMESIINTVNTVFLAAGNSVDPAENLSQLRKCLQELIAEENKAIKSSNALAKIQSHLNDSLLEGRVVDNLEEMFERALRKEKHPELNVDKHEMMAKFESRYRLILFCFVCYLLSND